MEREKLGSRLGFILLSAGCAIGIGNVWKFPYMAGEYGGAIFVLFYLLFLVIMGLPIMVVEFSIGRAARKSPVKMLQVLEKPGQKWHVYGIGALAGNYMLMMFYTTVAGWMLCYLGYSVTGAYEGMDSAGVAEVFSGLLADPVPMVIAMVIVVVLAFLILSVGLQNGLERVTKVMMLFLLVLMVVLAVHSITLEGGGEGLAFYLQPDLSKLESVGLASVLKGALTQAFFTLSLGIGAMAIFGSYIGKDRSLLGESVNVAVLDTLVAICSGLIIFPACAAYDISVDSGPSLLFITLPNVFNHLPGGRIWGSLFFLFMVFAAFSTVLAVFENIVSMFMDLFSWSRKKACLVNIPLMILLSLPCTLGFNLLSGIQPMGAGSSFLDLEDFIVSNLLLPIGSLVLLFFCVLKSGWGWKAFHKEANTGKGMKFGHWLRPYMTFVLPVLIVVVLVVGLVQ